jgi:hypothetical protein
VRYKTDGVWYDLTPGGLAWPRLVSELTGLAGVRDADFPKEGIINLAYGGVRLRFKVRVTSPAAECVLQNLGSDLV